MVQKNNGEQLLSQQEKLMLLNLARHTIEKSLEGKKPSLPERIPPILMKKLGAFVTLHQHHKLRGCIGYIHPVKPLLETIVEMAEAAAFHDPRFTPITEDDVSGLHIEISVLSPLVQINDYDHIIVGKHGLFVERDYSSGLLLPQVATEQNWDSWTFLSNTCLKAGLPADAWRDSGTKVSIFTAEIFSE